MGTDREEKRPSLPLDQDMTDAERDGHHELQRVRDEATTAIAEQAQRLSGVIDQQPVFVADRASTDPDGNIRVQHQRRVLIRGKGWTMYLVLLHGAGRWLAQAGIAGDWTPSTLDGQGGGWTASHAVASDSPGLAPADGTPVKAGDVASAAVSDLLGLMTSVHEESGALLASSGTRYVKLDGEVVDAAERSRHLDLIKTLIDADVIKAAREAQSCEGRVRQFAADALAAVKRGDHVCHAVRVLAVNHEGSARLVRLCGQLEGLFDAYDTLNAGEEP